MAIKQVEIERKQKRQGNDAKDKLESLGQNVTKRTLHCA